MLRVSVSDVGGRLGCLFGCWGAPGEMNRLASALDDSIYSVILEEQTHSTMDSQENSESLLEMVAERDGL